MQKFLLEMLNWLGDSDFTYVSDGNKMVLSKQKKPAAEDIETVVDREFWGKREIFRLGGSLAITLPRRWTEDRELTDGSLIGVSATKHGYVVGGPDDHIRRIIKMGSSLALTIPNELLGKLTAEDSFAFAVRGGLLYLWPRPKVDPKKETKGYPGRELTLLFCYYLWPDFNALGGSEFTMERIKEEVRTTYATALYQPVEDQKLDQEKELRQALDLLVEKKIIYQTENGYARTDLQDVEPEFMEFLHGNSPKIV